MTKPTILLITGAARSGTSAITNLLNRHPACAIGMERYKLYLKEAASFSESLFSKDRFLEIRSTDTNILPSRPGVAARIESFREKYEDCSCVGDKIPNRMRMFGEIMIVCQRVKVIYMLRDVSSVAASWQRRAGNEADSWSEALDYKAAVAVWNNNNEAAFEILSSELKISERFLVLSYESFFSGDSDAFDALVRFLSLDPTPIREPWKTSVETYQKKIKNKPTCLSSAQLEYVSEISDSKTYGWLANRFS